MKKRWLTICTLTVLMLVLLTLCACNGQKKPINGNDTDPPQENDDPDQHSDTVHTHAYTEKNTASAYLQSEANCTRAALYYYSCACGEKGTEAFLSGSRAAHVFDQKNTDEQYLCSSASTSSAATYYYSCSCGEKGTGLFKYGAAISGWRNISKTVYCTRLVSLHTIADDTRFYCENVWIGRSLKVIATDGTWYKVEYEYHPQGFAYIMCQYVTDNKDMVTFSNLNRPTAHIKDGKAGVYLCRDMNESSAAFFVPYGREYITIEAINKTGDWAKVRFYGYDANGAFHDASTIYYCPMKDIYYHP